MRKKSFGFNGFLVGRAADFFYREIRFIRQAITQDNPDIINAHWIYEYALAAIFSKKSDFLTHFWPKMYAPKLHAAAAGQTNHVFLAPPRGQPPASQLPRWGRTWEPRIRLITQNLHDTSAIPKTVSILSTRLSRDT